MGLTEGERDRERVKWNVFKKSFIVSRLPIRRLFEQMLCAGRAILFFLFANRLKVYRLEEEQTIQMKNYDWRMENLKFNSNDRISNKKFETFMH